MAKLCQTTPSFLKIFFGACLLILAWTYRHHLRNQISSSQIRTTLYADIRTPTGPSCLRSSFGHHRQGQGEDQLLADPQLEGGRTSRLATPRMDSKANTQVNTPSNRRGREKGDLVSGICVDAKLIFVIGMCFLGF